MACIYEIPVRLSKESMRMEIEQLQVHRRMSEQIFAALAKSDRPEDIIQQLKEGGDIDAVAARLEQSTPQSAPPSAHVSVRSDSFQSGTNAISDMQWESSGPSHAPSRVSRTSDWSPHSPGAGSTIDQARDRGQDFLLGPSTKSESAEHLRLGCSNQWTEVTSDGAFVEHLLTLYFCWEYPTFASISKEHFLSDFRQGRDRYCTPLLVNALLTLGCKFSNQPASRAVPDDPDTSGDHYFAEAERLLDLEDGKPTLTMVQALGLMSIREASCGRDSESWFYSGQSIRLAIELGLHLDAQRDDISDQDREVRCATFWGAFALDQ